MVIAAAAVHRPDTIRGVLRFPIGNAIDRTVGDGLHAKNSLNFRPGPTVTRREFIANRVHATSQHYRQQEYEQLARHTILAFGEYFVRLFQDLLRGEIVLVTAHAPSIKAVREKSLKPYRCS